MNREIKFRAWDKKKNIMDYNPYGDEYSYKELKEKIKKILKMDYLKWQLRKDLTKEKKELTINEAENRAKGWNACLKYILDLLKEKPRLK